MMFNKLTLAVLERFLTQETIDGLSEDELTSLELIVAKEWHNLEILGGFYCVEKTNIEHIMSQSRFELLFLNALMRFISEIDAKRVHQIKFIQREVSSEVVSRSLLMHITDSPITKHYQDMDFNYIGPYESTINGILSGSKQLAGLLSNDDFGIAHVKETLSYMAVCHQLKRKCDVGVNGYSLFKTNKHKCLKYGNLAFYDCKTVMVIDDVEIKDPFTEVRVIDIDDLSTYPLRERIMTVCYSDIRVTSRMSRYQSVQELVHENFRLI